MKFNGRDSHSHRWGLILAGGDGKRLLPLTRRIAGDDRAKPLCAVLADVVQCLSSSQFKFFKGVNHVRLFTNGDSKPLGGFR